MLGLEEGKQVSIFISELSKNSTMEQAYAEYKIEPQIRQKKSMNLRVVSKVTSSCNWIRKNITKDSTCLVEDGVIVRRLELVVSSSVITKGTRNTLFGVSFDLTYLDDCRYGGPDTLVVFTPEKMAKYNVTTIPTFDLRYRDESGKCIRNREDNTDNKLLPF